MLRIRTIEIFVNNAPASIKPNVESCGALLPFEKRNALHQWHEGTTACRVPLRRERGTVEAPVELARGGVGQEVSVHLLGLVLAKSSGMETSQGAIVYPRCLGGRGESRS